VSLDRITESSRQFDRRARIGLRLDRDPGSANVVTAGDDAVAGRHFQPRSCDDAKRAVEDVNAVHRRRIAPERLMPRMHCPGRWKPDGDSGADANARTPRPDIP